MRKLNHFTLRTVVLKLFVAAKPFALSAFYRLLKN